MPKLSVTMVASKRQAVSPTIFFKRVVAPLIGLPIVVSTLTVTDHSVLPNEGIALALSVTSVVERVLSVVVVSVLPAGLFWQLLKIAKKIHRHLVF